MRAVRPSPGRPVDRAAPVHADAAPARAELWWALAEMLSYPTPDLLDSVASGRLAERVAGAAAALPYGLAVDVAALGDPDGPAGAGGMGSDYLRLFEVPGPSGRPCPLHLGAHGGGRRAVMEEFLRFYRHFGLTTAGSAEGDLPDAVPTVAEFLAFLATLEAASYGGDRAAARAAQRDVLERRVAPAAAVIAERVGRLAPPPFYDAVTGLLARYAAAEASALTD